MVMDIAREDDKADQRNDGTHKIDEERDRKVESSGER